MTIFSTPKPLFDGIMFLTACDVDFILKCEWIHISGGSMWNVYLSKTKVHHEMTHSIHNVCRTLSYVHRTKLFEFLKYNNICSLSAILNESIFMRVIHEICTNLRNGENYALWRHIHSSNENVARFEWMTLHKPRYAKKK
jgi:hypothetical protein